MSLDKLNKWSFFRHHICILQNWPKCAFCAFLYSKLYEKLTLNAWYASKCHRNWKAQEHLLCSHWNCANFLIKERCLESPIMQFDPDYCYISMSYMYIWYILFWYKMRHDSVFLTSFMYSSCLFVFSSKNLSLIVPIYVIKFKSLFSGCMLISFCC